MPANRLQIIPLNEGGLGGSGRDLEELLWTAAWHASAGRLPEDCHRHDVIELTRWPNLSRLPGDADIMRLCALLSRSAHGLTLACRLLDVSEEDANRFYSAALYSGILRQISRNSNEVEAANHPTDPVDSTTSSKLGQTLRALWKRLKGD